MSLWFAYELRFSGGEEMTKADQQMFAVYLHQQRLLALVWIVPLKVLLLGAFGQFDGVFYFFRLPDALKMGIALAATAALALIVPAFFVGVGPDHAARAVRKVVPRTDCVGGTAAGAGRGFTG